MFYIAALPQQIIIRDIYSERNTAWSLGNLLFSSLLNVICNDCPLILSSIFLFAFKTLHALKDGGERVNFLPANHKIRHLTTEHLSMHCLMLPFLSGNIFRAMYID